MAVYCLDVMKGVPGTPVGMHGYPVRVKTIMLNVLAPSKESDKAQGIPGTMLAGNLVKDGGKVREGFDTRGTDFISYPQSAVRRTTAEMNAVAAYWGGDFCTPTTAFKYSRTQVANEPFGSEYVEQEFNMDTSSGL